MAQESRRSPGAGPVRRRSHTSLPLAVKPSLTASPVVGYSFLLGYLHTLTVLLGGLALLLFGWNWASSTTWAAGHPWPAAVAATTGWALGVAGWLLHRRGWHGARLHAVSWAAPVAVLVPLTWPGWLSPDGLLLWAPLTTVLAVALATTLTPTVSSPAGANTPATSA